MRSHFHHSLIEQKLQSYPTTTVKLVNNQGR